MIFRTITDDITGANKSIGLFGRSLNDFKGIINSFKQNGFVSTLLNTPLIKIDTDAIDVYNNQIRSSIPYEQALAVARKTTNACTLALIESSNGLEVQTERVTAAQLASTIAAKAHSVSFKAASIAGNIILFTAITKGIQLATTALDNWINRSKYAIEAMEKAQQTINDAQNKLKNVSTTIEENKDRFLELSEGVDKFSKNIKLSEEDYAEYLSISNKLAAISPELITGYTNQGDALLYIGNNAEEVNKKLNTILEAEQAIAQQTLVDNMDDVAKGIYYEVDKANFDIANLEAELNTVSTVFRDIENIIKTVDDDIGSIDFGTGSGLNLDSDEMEQLKNAIRNSGAKITEDTVFDSMIFSSSEIPLVQKAIENFYKQLDYTRKNESAAYINGITKDIQKRENAIKNAYAKMTPNLVAWVKSTYEYDFLDEQKKNLIKSLIPNLDWNDIKEKTGVKLFSDAEYEQYIKENIIVPLMSIPDEYQDDINKKFAKLLEFKSGDIDVVDFISELQEYLDSIGITIDVKPLMGDTEELKESYEQITSDAAYKFIEMSSKNYGLLDAERQALDDFAKQNSINTRDEIAFWNQCLEESTTREQAMEKYLGSSNSVNEKPNLSAQLASSQESLDKFQSSIKSAADAYTTLLSGNYSTSELLNSIQTINQAVGDMGGSLNWEYINQSEDSLKLLGDTIEHISQKYAESVLSDAGIDVNSDFGRMLSNIVQETYEAEAKFTGMNAQLDALQSSYQTLTGILESYNDTGYISLDNLQSLLTADENLISMLEVENGQLVLNQEAYENLVAVQLLEFKEKLNNAAAAEIEALAKQKSAEATNSNAQASEDAVAKLDAETEAFNRNTSAAIANAVTKAEEEGVPEDEIQSVLDKYNEIWNAAVNNFDGDFDSFMGGTKSAGASGSSAGNAYVDAFEEESKELDDLHSNSLISEKEYLDRLRVLYERYFKDKLGYEKEFANYQKKYLDGYKSLYESVFSHASKVIGDRVDAINDEKDAAIESLEAQKKAADDSYNAQIKLLEDKKDALQAEIDKIKEANEDRRQAIDLQKAEYELARMQNQRTILQYSEDKGVHYVTDTLGIRDARNDLDDKKADAQIRALEKQQDALDKQIDAIQEMLDASNEYWDTQIEQTEKYYDAMIQGMEKYKSRWEELSDLQEHAEMAALLKELGYTEEDLLNSSSGAFDALRTSYLGILKDMNDGNQGILDGLSQLANIDMSSIPSFLAETQGYMNSIANMDVTALSDGLNNVSNSFSNVADSASNAVAAISGNGETSSDNSTGINPSGKGSTNNKKNSANGSLKDAITEATTGSVEEINKISDAFAGENEEGTSVTGAVQKVIDKVGSVDSGDENSNSLMSTLKEQTGAALNEESGIPAQTYAWDELNTPLGESVDLVTTLRSTLEDMDGRTFTVTLNVAGNGSPNSIVSEFSGGVSNSPGHGGGGKSRARVQGTANVEGTANAKGNWGVKKAGRSLVGELGQELWVHSKDGTFETVGDNGAEFIDIKPNDIIFNHLQTKQLLDKGNIIGRGRSYANGSALVNGTNDEGWITLSDGLLARPLQEGDKSWDLMQKFQPLADRLLKGETDIMSNAMIEHQKQMEQLAGDITTMNVTTNNKPSVTIGDIHVTCPGVTSKEVAKQVGVELNNMFSGLHLDAMQQSMMR